MSQPKSLEEIMQRIRAQVGGGRNSGPAAETRGDSVRRYTSERSEYADGEAALSTKTSFNLKLHELSQLKVEIQTAQEGSRQVGQINPRNPGLVNDAIQFAKKVMRRSLTWYTRPLHYHQGGVVRAFDQIYAILDNHCDMFRKLSEELSRRIRQMEAIERSLEQNVAPLDEKLSSLTDRIKVLDDQLARISASLAATDIRVDQAVHTFDSSLKAEIVANEQRIAAAATIPKEALGPITKQFEDLDSRQKGLSSDLIGLREELQQTRHQLREASDRARLHERDVRRALYTLQNGPGTPGLEKVSTPPMFVSDLKGESGFDYFAFEDRYRGEESDIRSRQKEYLEYFRGREDVVDIGCGRGEFLELLRENQIRARGVELGLDQYLLCKEKGLDVVQADLFDFLESIPDESLGGLFSAQVIEHMTADDQLRYVALAHRKTKPGSPVIFETINAQCVYAVVRNFFLDPTHVRPIHPETLKFAMEGVHFKNVELRFSGPVSDKQIPKLHMEGDAPQLAAFNRSMEELNDLIFGYQDYAAIGWK